MRIVSQDAVHTAYKPYRNESFWNSTVTVLSLLSDHLHLHTGTAGNWHSHLIREQVPGPGPCISPMLLDPAVKRQPVVTDLTWKFTSLTQTLWFFSTGRLFMKTIFSHGFSVPEEARGHIFISFYQRPYQGLTFKSDHLICGEEIMFCTAFYATKCSWK